MECEGEGVIDGLADGDADELLLGLVDAEGDTEPDGDTEGLVL